MNFYSEIVFGFIDPKHAKSNVVGTEFFVEIQNSFLAQGYLLTKIFLTFADENPIS